MQQKLREIFNADFTPACYAEFLRLIDGGENCTPGFRMSETPIFLTPGFAAEVAGAARGIVAQLRTPEFARHARTAIPAGLDVPRETPHPQFLQVDFGICTDPADDNHLTPRLIELQGFPSLYAFQPYLCQCVRGAFPAVPRDWLPYFSGMDDRGYFERLRQVIVGSHSPENVILLEIEPEKQKTRIDFACTETRLGVRAVDVSAVIKRGRRLFYRRDGSEVLITRIYNRLIFDELLRRPDVRPAFRLQDDVEVEWAGHPNWYFRVSKHSLPFLKTPHCPPAYFADEFPAGERLADFVLKPLYSFAGLGVDVEPTREKLAALNRPHDWILQGKVEYAEFVPTPDGPRSKAEIRLMFLWPDGGEPILACNLVRMSQGKMMGVDFNREKTWVGSSIGLLPPGEW